MKKELLRLTGGIAPMVLVTPALKERNQTASKWYHSIKRIIHLQGNGKNLRMRQDLII